MNSTIGLTKKNPTRYEPGLIIVRSVGAAPTDSIPRFPRYWSYCDVAEAQLPSTLNLYPKNCGLAGPLTIRSTSRY